MIFINPASITMRSGLACLLSLAGVALTNATLNVEKRDGPGGSRGTNGTRHFASALQAIEECRHRSQERGSKRTSSAEN